MVFLQNWTLIRRFPSQDAVRRQQFAFEDALKEQFPSGAQSFNTPAEAPPNVARFGFFNSGTAFLMSGNAAQFQSSVIEGMVAKTRWSDLTKVAQTLDFSYDSFLKDQRRWFSSVALAWDANSSERDYRLNDLCKEIFLDKSAVPLSSLTLSIGRQEGDLTVVINITQFKNYSIPARSNQLAPSFVDDEFDPSSGSGVKIILEYNNRASSAKPPLQSNLGRLLEAMRRGGEAQLASLLGGERAKTLMSLVQN